VLWGVSLHERTARVEVVWILTSKQCLPDVNLIQNDQATLEMVSSERLGIFYMNSDSYVFSADSFDISARSLAQNTLGVWVGVLA
jgi:hypothetical protein